MTTTAARLQAFTMLRTACPIVDTRVATDTIDIVAEMNDTDAAVALLAPATGTHAAREIVGVLS